MKASATSIAPTLYRSFRLSLISTVAIGATPDQLEGIVELTDRTPALATELNNNKRILSDKFQNLEARVRLLEDTFTDLTRAETADSPDRHATTPQSFSFS